MANNINQYHNYQNADQLYVREVSNGVRSEEFEQVLDSSSNIFDVRPPSRQESAQLSLQVASLLAQNAAVQVAVVPAVNVEAAGQYGLGQGEASPSAAGQPRVVDLGQNNNQQEERFRNVPGHIIRPGVNIVFAVNAGPTAVADRGLPVDNISL